MSVLLLFRFLTPRNTPIYKPSKNDVVRIFGAITKITKDEASKSIRIIRVNGHEDRKLQKSCVWGERELFDFTALCDFKIQTINDKYKTCFNTLKFLCVYASFIQNGKISNSITRTEICYCTSAPPH